MSFRRSRTGAAVTLAVVGALLGYLLPWGHLALGVLYLVVCLLWLRSSRFTLVVGPDGIVDGHREIGWEEVTDIELGAVAGSPHLVVSSRARGQLFFDLGAVVGGPQPVVQSAFRHWHAFRESGAVRERT